MLNKLKSLLKDSDTKEILEKGFSFVVFRLGGLLAGYVFTFLIARIYGASINGLVALGFSLFMFTSIFGRLGADINLVRFYASESNWMENEGLFYRVLLKSFAISCILAGILYLFKGFFASTLFNKPQLEPYVVWVAITIPLWNIAMVCAGLLRAKQKNNWFAFLNSPGRFLFSLLAFLVLWAIVDNPINAIKAHFYGVLVLALLALVVSVKTMNGLSLKSKANSWSFLKEAFPMMLSATMIIFLGWMDTFVLGIYETDSVVGIYSVALKIAALTSLSLQAINSILAPKVAKNYQEGNTQQFKKLIRFSTHLNFYITVCVVSIIIVFHGSILALFGNEFVSGSTILVFLCIGQLINSLSGSVGLILQMTGHQKVYQNIILMALVINLILNFVLTPIYGAIGAATATVVSIASWNIAGAVYMKIKMDVESYFNPFKNIKNDKT